MNKIFYISIKELNGSGNNRILQKHRIPMETQKGEKTAARKMERENGGSVSKAQRF